MPWLRRVELIITNREDPENKVIYHKHRIDVEVRSTIGWPADTANINIFNLSLDEVKYLQSKEYGALGIEIRAGYLDDERSGVAGMSGFDKYNHTYDKPNGETRVLINKPLLTLFSGTITNAVGFKRPPEHLTQLFCISKASGLATDFKQMRPLTANQTLGSAIEQMTKDYGFSLVSFFGLSDTLLETKLKRPRVFHDVFLNEFRQLLSEFNLMFTMTTNEIQVFPETYGDLDAVNRMARDRAPIKLDVNSVLGSPIVGIATLQLDTFINPTIQPGMIMDITPLLGDGILANGVLGIKGEGYVLNTDASVFRWAMTDKYSITDVVHRVSTHVPNMCVTSVIATIGGATDMGQNEAAWQSRYKESGMGLELE